MDQLELHRDVQDQKFSRRAFMVLIVDDHHDTCEALQRMLQARGINAQFALDAASAMQHMKNELPQVVILDDMMPGKTGMELLKDIKTDPLLSDVPVIFYSAVFDFDRTKA